MRRRPEDPEGASELDLLIHANPVHGETLAELGFDWASILTGRTEGYVRLSGPTDALEVRGALHTAGARWPSKASCRARATCRWPSAREG
jgi:hypothetical protein